MGALSQLLSKKWNMADVSMALVCQDFIKSEAPKFTDADPKQSKSFEYFEESVRMLVFYREKKAWLHPCLKLGMTLWEVKFPEGSKFKSGPLTPSPFGSISANWVLNRFAPGFATAQGHGKGELATQEPKGAL